MKSILIPFLFFSVACSWEFYKVLNQTESRTIYGSLIPRKKSSKWSSLWLKLDHVAKYNGRMAIQNYTKLEDTRFHDNYDEILPNLFLGSMPLHEETVATLSNKHHVRNVINMLKPYEYENITSFYDLHHWAELQLPTPDHKEPRLIDLEAGVEFIIEKLKVNEGIYVHCQAGVGRSAAIVYAYLLHIFPEKSRRELQAMLLKKRSIVRPKLYLQRNIDAFAKRRPQRANSENGVHYLVH